MRNAVPRITNATTNPTVSLAEVDSELLGHSVSAADLSFGLDGRLFVDHGVLVELYISVEPLVLSVMIFPGLIRNGWRVPPVNTSVQ